MRKRKHSHCFELLVAVGGKFKFKFAANFFCFSFSSFLAFVTATMNFFMFSNKLLVSVAISFDGCFERVLISLTSSTCLKISTGISCGISRTTLRTSCEKDNFRNEVKKKKNFRFAFFFLFWLGQFCCRLLFATDSRVGSLAEYLEIELRWGSNSYLQCFLDCLLMNGKLKGSYCCRCYSHCARCHLKMTGD